MRVVLTTLLTSVPKSMLYRLYHLYRTNIKLLSYKKLEIRALVILSGTGSSGATVRLYIDSYEDDKLQ